MAPTERAPAQRASHKVDGVALPADLPGSQTAGPTLAISARPLAHSGRQSNAARGPPRPLQPIRLPPHPGKAANATAKAGQKGTMSLKRICIGPPGNLLSQAPGASMVSAPPVMTSDDGNIFNRAAHDDGTIKLQDSLNMSDVVRLVHMLLLAHMKSLGYSVEVVKQGLTDELERWKRNAASSEGLSHVDVEALREHHPYLHVRHLASCS